jgi:hypothetical protein
MKGITTRAGTLQLPRSRAGQFLLLLGFALLIRGPSFGEWNFDIDEQFYALVGQRLLAGDLLYVDIWDRKPPALYLVYSVISLISRSFLAYHLAATLSATLGAWGIARQAQRFTAAPGALMAGTAYLAMLNRFGGASGQAPVWFNTLMIFAGWAILTRTRLLERGRIDPVLSAGMAAAGIAIAFKQSAAIECLFFGLWIAAILLRSSAKPLDIIWQLGVLAMLGILPMAATFALYWHAGHVPELWHALVDSNFERLYAAPAERLMRLAALLGLLGMPLVFAVMGWACLIPAEKRDRRILFLIAWSGVALLAVASFPNVFYHYALPVLPPLCVLCAVFFDRRAFGRLALAVLVVVNLAYAGTFDLATRYRAHRDTPAFVDYVRQETPHGRLLVWGIPNYLYSLVGTHPPSALAFPPHLYEGAERGVSGLDERAELQRVLKDRPETVVIQEPIVARPLNQPNVDAVEAYVRGCARVRRFTIYDHNGAQVQAVHSRCGNNPPAI